MTFCKNCGAPMDGNFCTSCGSPTEAVNNTPPQVFANNNAPQAFMNNNPPQAFMNNTPPQAFANNNAPQAFMNNNPPQAFMNNNAPQAIVHNNVDVRARYTTKMQAMAGIGFYLLSFGIPQALGAVAALLALFIEHSGGMIAGALALAVFSAVLVGGGIMLYRPGLKSIRANTPDHLYKKTKRTFILRSVLFLFAWSVSIMCCMFILGIVFGAWNIGIAATRPKEDNYTAFFNGQMIPVKRTEDWQFFSPTGTRYIFVDDNGVFYRPPLSSNIR